MAGQYSTVTDPAALEGARGAVSGHWKFATYTDPTPPQSLPVNPAHLRGSFPPGKAPIKARPGNVPIVVIDNADDWAGWGSPGQAGGWQRLGNTPTDDHPAYLENPPAPPGTPTRGASPSPRSPAGPPARLLAGLGFDAHDAYQVSSGVGFPAALAEADAARRVDLGAVAGRARGPSETHDTNRTVLTGWPLAGGPGYQPGVALARGGNALPFNNPEGFLGHTTPRMQRFSNTAINFGPALRTHHGHTLRPHTPWAHTTTTVSPHDPYGSPFDAAMVLVNTGTTSPERMVTPTNWDQTIVDTPGGGNIPSSEDSNGYYGGAYGGDWGGA